MAFTRRFLTALGIEADKVDEIINAHIEVVDALKEDRDNYKKDAEKLSKVQKELDEANKKIAKNGDENPFEEKYNKLKKEFDDFKQDAEKKATLEAKQKAYRELAKGIDELSETGIDKAVKYAKYDEVELDENGKIKDAEKHTEFIKSEWGGYKKQTTTQYNNPANPPANSGGSTKTKEEILAIKDGETRRSEMAKNPHLFGIETD
jgi:hypothetical protein